MKLDLTQTEPWKLIVAGFGIGAGLTLALLMIGLFILGPFIR